MQERASEAGFFGRIGLLVPAVLAPVGETALLRAIAPRSAALGAQASAPPPLDLFHDLRWVSVFHNSWWLFGVELAAVLLVRSAWIAWVVRRSWPESAPIEVALLAAAIAGLLNARALYGLVQDIALGRVRRPLPALTPVLVAAVFGVTVGGTALGFAVAIGQHDTDRQATGPLPAAR